MDDYIMFKECCLEIKESDGGGYSRWIHEEGNRTQEMGIGENGTFGCIMDRVGDGNIAIVDALINIAVLVLCIVDMAFGVGK